MTRDEWQRQSFRLDALATLAAAYEQEHDFANDDDPGASWELLRDVRAIHAELLARLGEAPEPATVEYDPNMPF